MDYFGDSEKLPKGCGRCDNCQTPEAPAVDIQTQETVRILLSGAARLGGRFGSSQLADLVTGSDTAQIRRYAHERLPTYGRLSSMSKRQVQALIQALIRQGYLRQEGLRYPVLMVTDEGREVMYDRVRARLGSWQPAAAKKSRQDPAARRAPSSTQPSDENEELREMLRDWRSRKSKELGVPPYSLFWDRTLDELCARRPATLGELGTIWGIGEQKLRSFGAQLLALIASSTA
jgi:ATP-dependent DNA helicase RecQ